MDMKLEHGKVFVNKTLKYFKPIFWEKYRNIYLDSIFKNRVKFAAYGIGDALLTKSYDNHLFVLIDVLRTKKDKMDIVLDMSRDLPFYENDYTFNMFDGYHMLVFSIPEEIQISFNEFKNSRYSKILCNKELSNIYDKRISYWKEAISVINKDDSAKELYINRIKSYYSIDDDVINTMMIDEYDFPIDHMEYFNSHILLTNGRKKI